MISTHPPPCFGAWRHNILVPPVTSAGSSQSFFHLLAWKVQQTKPCQLPVWPLCFMLGNIYYILKMVYVLMWRHLQFIASRRFSINRLLVGYLCFMVGNMCWYSQGNWWILRLPPAPPCRRFTSRWGFVLHGWDYLLYSKISWCILM